MNKKICILIFGIFFVSLASLVSAQVPTFHQFYGNVVYPNGSLVIDQPLSVLAFIDGEWSGVGLVDSNGHYGNTNPFFVYAIIDQIGSTISFYIDSYFSINYTFQEENITNLDLVYNSSSPSTCIDADGDGYSINGGEECGPKDCNDANAAINPGATETCGDGVDQNCDGRDLSCSSSTSSSSGSSGGSGGGGVTTTFKLDRSQISIVVLQGDTQPISFVVSDDGIGSGAITITSDLALIKTQNFNLSAGKSTTVNLNVATTADTIPNVYTGHIYVTVKGVRQTILTDVTVLPSNASLFDLILTIPQEYSYVLPGKKVYGEFFLTKMTPEQVKEVLIKYIIKDENDKVILSQEETLVVDENQEPFMKEFEIPKGTNYGKYMLYSQLVYDNKTALASSWFNVGPRKIDNMRWFIIIAVLAMAIISIIIVLVIHYNSLKKQQSLPAQQGY